MISGNFNEFGRDLREFVNDDVPADLQRQKNALGLLALASLILATPRDTGYAQSGWYLTAGDPSNRVPPEGSTQPKDPSEQLSAVAEAPVLIPLWVTNNVVYIIRLDDGHSQQAPAGMMAQLSAALRKELA